MRLLGDMQDDLQRIRELLEEDDDESMEDDD
jgi:hypothetical protein